MDMLRHAIAQAQLWGQATSQLGNRRARKLNILLERSHADPSGYAGDANSCTTFLRRAIGRRDCSTESLRHPHAARRTQGKGADETRMSTHAVQRIRHLPTTGRACPCKIRFQPVCPAGIKSGTT
eukprot:8823189-Alexandrium_andersonii.AAC.1